MSDRRSSIMFVLACASGWLVWHSSPAVWGTVEPWDAGLLGYGLVTVIAAFATALIRAGKGWIAAVGVVVGQAAYAQFIVLPSVPSGDPVILPPLVSVSVFAGLPAMLGVTVAWLVTPRRHR